MKNRLLIASFFAFAFALASTAPAPAAVELTPFRIEESRSVALVKETIGHSPDSLKVIFSINGPEVDSAVKYGELHLDEAVDDAGTNLIPEKNSFHDATKFKEFDNAFFRKMDLQRKVDAAAPQISIGLVLPKRSASKIARLRGTLSLSQQGTIKTVELSGLNKPAAQKLDIPAGAGIAITVTVTPGKDVTSVPLEITGDENALESIEVLDASGTKISNGMSSWSFGDGPAHKSIDLQKPLDDSMKLVAKIAVDRKITKVPFDLKDIALP